MIHVKLSGCHFVTVLPPGQAANCNLLRDRGRTDIIVEVTAWPSESHHGKLTTGEPWRSIDDHGSPEATMIHKIEQPTEADLIRLNWLGRQRWYALAADAQARRVLKWFVRPDDDRAKALRTTDPIEWIDNTLEWRKKEQRFKDVKYAVAKRPVPPRRQPRMQVFTENKEKK